jgi:hypothetical protein
VKFGNGLLAQNEQSVLSAELVTVAIEIVAEIVAAKTIESHTADAEQSLQMENSWPAVRT